MTLSHKTEIDVPAAENGTRNGIVHERVDVMPDKHTQRDTEIQKEDTILPNEDVDNEEKSKLSTVFTAGAIWGVLYDIAFCGLLFRTMPVVYVELVRIYGIKRTEASVLQLLYTPVATCTSVINVYFVQRFGLGKMLLVGSILICAGLIGTAFATTPTQIIAVLGLITGGILLLEFLIALNNLLKACHLRQFWTLVVIGLVLYFCHGPIHISYGHSLTYSCSMFAPPYLLTTPKFRNTLTVVISVFSGLGLTFGSPLISVFFENYGMSTSMLLFAVLGAVTIIGNVFCWLRTRKSEGIQPNRTSTRKCSALLTLVKNRLFLGVLCVEVMRAAFNNILSVTLVDHAYTLGFSLETSAFFAGTNGFGNLCGRIASGALFSLKTWRGINQYSITVVVFGALLVCMALVESYIETLVVSFFCGLISGAISTFRLLLLYEILETEQYSMGLTAVITIYGTSSMIVNPLAGWVRDTQGSYNILYIVGLPFLGIPGGLLLAYQLTRTCCRKHRSEIDEETSLIGDSSSDDTKSDELRSVVGRCESVT